MQATPEPQAAPVSRVQVEACLRARARELHDTYGVQELSLFGSVARDEGGAGSDVDLLVAFRSPPGFDGYMKLKWRLEELLGRRVDLVMDGALIPDARRVIEAEAGPCRAAAGVHRDGVSEHFSMRLCSLVADRDPFLARG